jgi:MgsA AAA+ ATPase C terminal
MKARWAVDCRTSAALVERFNRGWFPGSLTAETLRHAKNSHGLLVTLIVRRPMRAGPRAHRESASGQKRTPITEYRKNKATCHASPPAPPHTSPHWELSPAAPARQRLASSVDRQAGRAPCRAAKVQADAMERYASQPDAAMYDLARMVEADEDPQFIARRMVIFASNLKYRAEEVMRHLPVLST